MTQEQKDLILRDKIKANASLESSLAKMRHELKMTQLKRDGLIVYSLLNFADRTESELFPTKEELLNSL